LGGCLIFLTVGALVTGALNRQRLTWELTLIPNYFSIENKLANAYSILVLFAAMMVTLILSPATAGRISELKSPLNA
jgi:hypothetical protein